MDCEILFVRTVPGFQDYYATEDGRIFSKRRKMFEEVKGSISADGYRVVQLISGTDKIKYRVHRLIALSWLTKLDGLEIVNHKDGNKLNNTVTNLEWSTKSQNTKHAHDNGLIKKSKRAVCQIDRTGKLIAEYSSVTEAARANGASIGQISDVCSGKKLMCKGFAWYYKEEYVQGVRKRVNGHCKEVYQLSLDGKLIKTFKSITEAAKSTGIISQNISAACNGIQQTSGGYKWEFAPQKVKPENSCPIEIESWISLREFPLYKISRRGEIYSFVTNKYIKISRISGQRDHVYLLNTLRKPKHMYVHRLVALAYIPNPKNLPVVNHKDGDCYNNTVENLEWCTYQENTIHAYETNLNSNKVGVVQVSSSGIEVYHDSIAKAARSINVTAGAIGYALRTGAKCKGFAWRKLK